MNPKYCLGIILFALLNASGASFGAGPREPLTFKNVGQYGPWCEYLVSKDLPYDFLIVQAIVFPDHIEWNGWTKDDTTPWNEYLKRARANGRRVIADVHPALYTEEGELQTMNDSYRCKKPVPVERFFPLFDKFFKEVDEEELYAMTISEEHDSKSGQPQRLNAVYGNLKKNYKIDAYQWYTPSREGSIPGLNYPNLKADGWMADEYYLQQPAMEVAMRAYTIQQKPAFQIIWASPDCDAAPWSERTFWEQYEVCRKYDIPVAFFCYADGMKGPHGNKWSWDPRASDRMKQVLDEYCVYAAKLAKRLPPVTTAEWDFVPWAPKWIKLQAADGRATYQESFAKDSGLAVCADASISGFANLKWDSANLELRPRAAGEAQTTLQYHFVVPKKARKITIKLAGKTSGGTVELCLANIQDKVLAQTELKGDSAVIDYDASDYNDTRFVVLCRLKGQAATVGATLAELSDISVTAELSE